jgi:hypothetical protein
MSTLRKHYTSAKEKLGKFYDEHQTALNAAALAIGATGLGYGAYRKGKSDGRDQLQEALNDEEDAKFNALPWDVRNELNNQGKSPWKLRYFKKIAAEEASGKSSGLVDALKQKYEDTRERLGRFYDENRDKIHTAGKVALGLNAAAGLGYGMYHYAPEISNTVAGWIMGEPKNEYEMAQREREGAQWLWRQHAIRAKASGFVPALRNFYDKHRDKIHTAGKVALGTLAAAGLGYGAYRGYDAYRQAMDPGTEREFVGFLNTEHHAPRAAIDAERAAVALADSPIRSRLIPVVRKQHHGNPSLEKELRSGIPDIPPEYAAVVAPGRRPNFRPFATEQPRSTGIADRMGAPATGQYIYPEHRSPARQSEPF